jgi:arginine decarboxylase
MAMLGIRLGKKVVMVAEKVEEVKAIVQVSREMGVEPMIGVRVRLSSKGSGRWATSGGELAKFGLAPIDLMEAVGYLQEEGMGHTLRLVHFHIGSQIPDILSIKRATREAARYYAKLRQQGLDHIDHIDVGGGLGVDYDGSNTAFHSSTNYTMEEYAQDIVYNIADVCDEEKVPHPNIVSESGRAIVAHHSLLVVQAFGAIEKTKAEYDLSVVPTDHRWVRQLAEIKERIPVNPLEALHDTQQIKQDSQNAFELGIMDLRTKAKIETFYWHIMEEVVTLFQARAANGAGGKEIPEDVAELTPVYADQYLCNFSMFQSLLDHWAVGQLFPIMPIHRLDERPLRSAVLADITCDSDGKIDRFVSLRETKRTIEVHDLRDGEPYYLAAFLVGAYQETLGDLHNLFGDTHVVHIKLHEEGGWWIEETVKGDTAAEVLRYMRYDVERLLPQLARDCERAVREGRLSLSDSQALRRFYDGELAGYTYLEPA